jgi:hypothetical protein
MTNLPLPPRPALRAWLIAGLVLALSAAWFSASRAQSTSAGFFSTVSDLPLMAGLAELTDEALFYDKPEGRIVEVAARGAVLQKDAMAFYADTLPQLGWSAVGDGFEREAERLMISYRIGAGFLIVRISINPK